MKRLLAALLMLPVLALAAGNDFFINQRNAADTATVTRPIAYPGPGVSALMAINGTTTLPVFFSVGAGLSLTGSALTATPQIQPDWNASIAPAAILNKPLLFSGAYSALTGIPATFAPTAHTQAFSTITSTPVTLAGYGITDGATLTQLATKLTIPAGTTAQYVRGDGSLATLPAPGAGTVTSVTAGTGLSGGTITSSGTLSMPSVGTAGTYNTVTTDAQGRVTAGVGRSFSNPARTLNTAFQVSTAQDSSVTYTVDISVTSLLLAGASGRVYLEYADNSAMTTNLVTVSSSPNATGGVLNVTNLGAGNVTGWIPAGKWARIRTASVSGSPTFTFVGSQEVLQ